MAPSNRYNLIIFTKIDTSEKITQFFPSQSASFVEWKSKIFSMTFHRKCIHLVMDLVLKLRKQNESKGKKCWFFLSLNNKQYAHSFNCQSSVSRAQASHTHSHSLTYARSYTHTVSMWMLREMQSTFTINTGKEWRRLKENNNAHNSQHWVRDFFLSRIENKLIVCVFFFCTRSLSFR